MIHLSRRCESVFWVGFDCVDKHSQLISIRPYHILFSVSHTSHRRIKLSYSIDYASLAPHALGRDRSGPVGHKIMTKTRNGCRSAEVAIRFASRHGRHRVGCLRPWAEVSWSLGIVAGRKSARMSLYASKNPPWSLIGVAGVAYSPKGGARHR